MDIYRWDVSRRVDVELLHHLLLPWLGDVKLTGLAAALERMPARLRPVHAGNDEWLAWAAGLFDGEGSVSLHPHRTHTERFIGEVAVTQSGNAGIPEVLHRILGIVQRGHINGPYRQSGAAQLVYRWKVEAQAEIEPALASLWPWLGSAKRAQATGVLEVLRVQPPLPRGNPAWGNRKTHCVNGHEYATARIRPFLARDGGEEPRASSACLECQREYARRRRAEKKRSPPMTAADRSQSVCRATC